MGDISINWKFLEAEDDGEAYKLLLNEYHKLVFAKINRMMWNHPDPAVGPEDMVQKTFLKAIEKRNEVREPEKLPGWLLAIAEKLTLNEIRDAKVRTGNFCVESLDDPSIGESEAHYRTSHTDTDAEQAEANRYMVKQILRLLQGPDLEIVVLMLKELTLKEIAEAIGSTPEAVQKRWERIRKWLIPIAHNLDALVNCLPGEDDRKVMERYLDGQPLSEIVKAIGISRSVIKQTVKRVIADWKKAARQNSTDPVSAMVKND